MGFHSAVTIKHWMPIVTICPENNLPDLIYISVTFTNEFQELYSIRTKIRKVASFKRMYMEDIAKLIFAECPRASHVSVRLLFNRHEVILTRTQNV